MQEGPCEVLLRRVVFFAKDPLVLQHQGVFSYVLLNQESANFSWSFFVSRMSM
jgi:hypothetical protein